MRGTIEDMEDPNDKYICLEVYCGQPIDRDWQVMVAAEIQKHGGVLHYVGPTVLTFEFEDEASFDRAYAAMTSLGIHAEPCGYGFGQE